MGGSPTTSNMVPGWVSSPDVVHVHRGSDSFERGARDGPSAVVPGREGAIAAIQADRTD
jgi:hypothetical protein